MTDNETLRTAVLEAMATGEGTPALVYADFLEEQGSEGPEFFRLLGRQLQSYPDWYYCTTTADESCGGRWDAGTSASRYIQRSLHYLYRDFARRYSNVSQCWVGLSPQLAHSMSRSREIDDFAPYAPQTPAYEDWRRRVNLTATYGLPDRLYGFHLWVLDAKVLPPDWAVLVDERAKCFGIITDCLWSSGR